MKSYNHLYEKYISDENIKLAAKPEGLPETNQRYIQLSSICHILDGSLRQILTMLLEADFQKILIFKH